LLFKNISLPIFIKPETCISRFSPSKKQKNHCQEQQKFKYIFIFLFYLSHVTVICQKNEVIQFSN
jgi:hypothetical protein